MPTLSEVEFEKSLDLVETTEETQKNPARLKQRKPPSRGLCRRCGENKPINRLMLCYPCWVKTELENRSRWREGMPHPTGCDCELADHPRKSFGN